MELLPSDPKCERLNALNYNKRIKTIKLIKYKIGKDIFKSKTDAIVNTVNCVGVMGAGLAKEFKKRFPEMYKDYRKICKDGKLKIGKFHTFRTIDRLIINFPTKKHWKNNSKLEWIEAGLEHFVKSYKNWDISSVAFPQLGTNHGKLNWSDVKTIMEDYLNSLDIEVEIYIRNANES